MRSFLLFIAFGLTLFVGSTLAATATAPPGPTQREWMSSLAETLGYTFGLPDEPTDENYISQLAGNRSYRFEAEEQIDPADLAAINSFDSFGTFSGRGWVCGLATPTRIHLNLHLPHTGEYRFTVATRLPGHLIELGGRTFKIDEPGIEFRRVVLGTLPLMAGKQTVTIDLPPNGSIDYLELTASSLPNISPLEGWSPNSPLSTVEISQSVVHALQLETILPPTDRMISIEAESAPGARELITTQQHLGPPSGNAWVRTGASAQELNIDFKSDLTAVYRILLRAAGTKPFSGKFDRHYEWNVTVPSYLDNRLIGTWPLKHGQHSLSIQIPPRGGVDAFFLQQRSSTAADYLTLTGLSYQPERPVTEQANRLLALLSRLKQPSQ